MQKASAQAEGDSAAALRLLHRDGDTHDSDLPSSARAGSPLDPRRLARLRWRCRRGMLENDLVLERFLARRGEAITEGEVAALDRLLDLPDSTLWDLIAGRAEPADPADAPLLELLRST